MKDYFKGLGCNAIWLNPFYKSLYMNISDRVIPLDESKVIIHSRDNKKELSNKESVLMFL